MKDKIAVITGGAGGIGKCIADEFKKAGAKVCIIDTIENEYFTVGISGKVWVRVVDNANIKPGDLITSSYEKGKGKKLFVVYTDLGCYACGCDGVEKTNSSTSKKYYELVCGDKSFKVYADEVLFGDSDAIAEIKASIPESN